MARHPHLFAVCPPGLEALNADEIAESGFRSIHPDHGGVRFRGHVGRANRVLACPTRILERIGSFQARTFSELEVNFQALDLGIYGGLSPSVTTRKSKLYHSSAVAERIEEWVNPGPTTLYVRISRDRCTISVDTSGERLHRRGWRLELGRAPMRETLAATCLRFAGWRPGMPLVDPMCGSGTLVIEAAVRAAGLPPGRLRGFACDGWSGPGRRDDAIAVDTITLGNDLDGAVIASAQRNAERAGVSPQWTQQNAAQLAAPSERGLLVCNPPYGQRVESQDPYRVLGDLLKTTFAQWDAVILCPSRRALKQLRRRSARHLDVTNGGIPLQLHYFPGR